MITQQDIKRYFTHPNKNISHREPSELPFSFVSRNATRLLVTIGDSWTWGYELSDRTNACYGNILSEKLGSDWLNLSVPGAGNHYIGQLYLYVTQRDVYYEDISCVIVLTETGRDFNGWFDRDVDYAGWLRTQINSSEDYYKFLEFINDFAIDQIVQNKTENIDILVGFNFIDPSSRDKLKHLLIPRTWLEVVLDESIADDKCHIVSPYIFEKLDDIFSIEWSLDKNLFRHWQVEQLEKSQQRINKITNSQHFYPEMHPTEHGHKIWAEYLYDILSRHRCQNV
jgi:hypothetical protein